MGKCVNFKIKIITLMVNLGSKISLEMGKCKSKNEASVSEILATLKGIYELPYILAIFKISSKYLDVVLKACLSSDSGIIKPIS